MAKEHSNAKMSLYRGESRGERTAALLREHGYLAKMLDGGYPSW